MPTLEITNNSSVDVVIWEPVFGSGVVTFAGAATLLPGTILARDTGTLKFVPFVKGGVVAGNGIPTAVLLNELVATGAGDLPASPIIGGRMRLSELVINADGDSSNVDEAVEDQLRDFGLVVLSTQQLAELDNQ